MNAIDNILVVIDPTTSHQKAFHRALHLARQTNASISLFTSIYDFSYEMTTMLSQEERDAMRKAMITDKTIWLEEVVQSIDTDGITIDIEIVWHNRPYEAILNKVEAGNYDLIVKGTHDHNVLKSVIFTPTDWHLLRKSHCPVLLVKDHAWPENGNILVAVNSGSDESYHQSLNQKVLADAQVLGKKIKGNVHLVNSYPGTPVNIAIEIPEFDANAYSSAIEKHHRKATSDLAEQFNFSLDQLHVKEGLPEDVIPAVAKEIDAELVIIGSVGRTGLSAALLGNTAEHIIDQLDCDVLAVRADQDDEQF